MHGVITLSDLARRIVERKEIPKYTIYLVFDLDPEEGTCTYHWVGEEFRYEDALNFIMTPDPKFDNVDGAKEISICLTFGDDSIPAAEISIIDHESEYLLTEDNWLIEDILEEIISNEEWWLRALERIQEIFQEEGIDELNDYFSVNLQ